MVVLTHRFWTTALDERPVGARQDVRLGDRAGDDHRRAGAVGAVSGRTEIIANVVTSPHHLSATMVTGRVHRMTELFGRLAPGADARAGARRAAGRARGDGDRAPGGVSRRKPTSASTRCGCAIRSPRRRGPCCWCCWRRPALVFVIACSNVANLILARSVRREGELAIRAALGASAAALRRTLLAESLVLCGAGALLGVLIARPMVSVLARYASRFSVRALDLTVDSHRCSGSAPGWRWSRRCCWRSCRGCRPPTPRTASASSSGSVRITTGTNRRLRVFAVTQIAASFVLLAGAGMLLTTLLALQAASTGFDMRRCSR